MKKRLLLAMVCLTSVGFAYQDAPENVEVDIEWISSVDRRLGELVNELKVLHYYQLKLATMINQLDRNGSISEWHKNIKPIEPFPLLPPQHEEMSPNNNSND